MCSLDLMIEQQRIEIKILKAMVKSQEATIERQGKEAYNRHEFLCTIKEIVDSYFEETT